MSIHCDGWMKHLSLFLSTGSPVLWSLAVYLWRCWSGSFAWKDYQALDFVDCVLVHRLISSSVACISCQVVVRSRGLTLVSSVSMTPSQVVLGTPIRSRGVWLSLSAMVADSGARCWDLLIHWRWQNVAIPIPSFHLCSLAGDVYK